MPRLSDMEMSRIEVERRMVLLVLEASSPVGSSEDMILNALRRHRYPTIPSEVKKYLDYLEQKGLAQIEDRDADLWHATITATGVDVLQGVVKTPHGIARS